MSHSQFHSIDCLYLRHAWLDLDLKDFGCQLIRFLRETRGMWNIGNTLTSLLYFTPSLCFVNKSVPKNYSINQAKLLLLHPIHDIETERRGRDLYSKSAIL